MKFNFIYCSFICRWIGFKTSETSVLILYILILTEVNVSLIVMSIFHSYLCSRLSFWTVSGFILSTFILVSLVSILFYLRAGFIDLELLCLISLLIAFNILFAEMISSSSFAMTSASVVNLDDWRWLPINRWRTSSFFGYIVIYREFVMLVAD